MIRQLPIRRLLFLVPLYLTLPFHSTITHANAKSSSLSTLNSFPRLNFAGDRVQQEWTNYDWFDCSPSFSINDTINESCGVRGFSSDAFASRSLQPDDPTNVLQSYVILVAVGLALSLLSIVFGFIFCLGRYGFCCGRLCCRNGGCFGNRYPTTRKHYLGVVCYPQEGNLTSMAFISQQQYQPPSGVNERSIPAEGYREPVGEIPTGDCEPGAAPQQMNLPNAVPYSPPSDFQNHHVSNMYPSCQILPQVIDGSHTVYYTPKDMWFSRILMILFVCSMITGCIMVGIGGINSIENSVTSVSQSPSTLMTNLQALSDPVGEFVIDTMENVIFDGLFDFNSTIQSDFDIAQFTADFNSVYTGLHNSKASLNNTDVMLQILNSAQSISTTLATTISSVTSNSQVIQQDLTSIQSVTAAASVNLSNISQTMSVLQQNITDIRAELVEISSELQNSSSTQIGLPSISTDLATFSLLPASSEITTVVNLLTIIRTNSRNLTSPEYLSLISGLQDIQTAYLQTANFSFTADNLLRVSNVFQIMLASRFVTNIPYTFSNLTLEISSLQTQALNMFDSVNTAIPSLQNSLLAQLLQVNSTIMNSGSMVAGFASNISMLANISTQLNSTLTSILQMTGIISQLIDNLVVVNQSYVKLPAEVDSLDELKYLLSSSQLLDGLATFSDAINGFINGTVNPNNLYNISQIDGIMNLLDEYVVYLYNFTIPSDTLNMINGTGNPFAEILASLSSAQANITSSLQDVRSSTSLLISNSASFASFLRTYQQNKENALIVLPILIADLQQLSLSGYCSLSTSTTCNVDTDCGSGSCIHPSDSTLRRCRLDGAQTCNFDADCTTVSSDRCLVDSYRVDNLSALVTALQSPSAGILNTLNNQIINARTDVASLSDSVSGFIQTIDSVRTNTFNDFENSLDELNTTITDVLSRVGVALSELADFSDFISDLNDVRGEVSNFPFSDITSSLGDLQSVLDVFDSIESFLDEFSTKLSKANIFFQQDFFDRLFSSVRRANFSQILNNYGLLEALKQLFIVINSGRSFFQDDSNDFPFIPSREGISLSDIPTFNDVFGMLFSSEEDIKSFERKLQYISTNAASQYGPVYFFVSLTNISSIKLLPSMDASENSRFNIHRITKDINGRPYGENAACLSKECIQNTIHYLLYTTASDVNFASELQLNSNPRSFTTQDTPTSASVKASLYQIFILPLLVPMVLGLFGFLLLIWSKFPRRFASYGVVSCVSSCNIAILCIGLPFLFLFLSFLFPFLGIFVDDFCQGSDGLATQYVKYNSKSLCRQFGGDWKLPDNSAEVNIYDPVCQIDATDWKILLPIPTIAEQVLNRDYSSSSSSMPSSITLNFSPSNTNYARYFYSTANRTNTMSAPILSFIDGLSANLNVSFSSDIISQIFLSIAQELKYIPFDQLTPLMDRLSESLEWDGQALDLLSTGEFLTQKVLARTIVPIINAVKGVSTVVNSHTASQSYHDVKDSVCFTFGDTFNYVLIGWLLILSAMIIFGFPAFLLARKRFSNDPQGLSFAFSQNINNYKALTKDNLSSSTAASPGMPTIVRHVRPNSNSQSSPKELEMVAQQQIYLYPASEEAAANRS